MNNKAPITIHINQLGPITNSSFEFKPFMLFTGDSGLGKSYAAFLMYYCVDIFNAKSFVKIIKNILDLDKIQKVLETEKEYTLKIKVKDFEDYLNTNATYYMGYLLGYEGFEADVEIKLNIEDFESKLKYFVSDKANSFIYTTNKGQSYADLSTSLEEDITNAIRHNILQEVSKKDSLTDTIFLPPARASLMGANFTTSNAIVSSAGMYQEFIENLDFLTQITKEAYEPDSDLIHKITEILKGSIKMRQGEMLYHFNGHSIPITAAASSVKELAPLFLLLNKFDPSQFSVLFEEPEAHLHPSMQEKVADLLALMAQHGTYFQITTHSDYFMHEINNLIRLHLIKQINPDRHTRFCLEHNINPSITLDPSIVGAYYFKQRKDGTVQIITQNANEGIPFDTFESTIDRLMPKSSIIEDYWEEMEND